MLFFAHCARRGLLRLPELRFGAAFVARALLGRLDEPIVTEAKRVGLRFEARLGDARARELYDRCFEEILWPRRRARVLREVDEAARRGPVFLVTANLRAFATRWGRALGIDEARCFGAEGVRGAGGVTDELVEPICLGERRAELVERLAREHDVPAREVAAFGDSAFDVPMLRAVGAPSAVYPSRALRKVARAAGWRVIEG